MHTQAFFCAQVIRQILLAGLCVLAITSIAYAQEIGPNLRPPGADKNEAVDAVDGSGAKKTRRGNTLQQNWDLNAADVVFSASKKRQLLSEAPSTIHVITSDDIKRYGWRTLSQILRHGPGVQVIQARSQQTSVMIRGLVGTEYNNSRILWLQNGIPLNDVRDAGMLLDGSYPVELIKRIEIVLGPGSALYGSGAFQGVVNIFTKDADNLPKYGSYQVGFGSNATLKSSAMAGYYNADKAYGLLAMVSANHTFGPGLIDDYVYGSELQKTAAQSVSNSRTPTSVRPPPFSLNSERSWYSAYLKANLKQWRLSAGYNEVDSGYDGTETLPRSAFEFNRRDVGIEALYDDEIIKDFSLVSVFSYRFLQYDFHHYGDLNEDLIAKINVDGNDQYDPSYPRQMHQKLDYNTKQHKVFALGQMQWRIFKSNELIAGLGLEYSHISAPEFAEKKQKIHLLTPSIFIQDEQRFFSDKLILTAGARFDYYKVNDSTRNAAPSWRAAALIKWLPSFSQRLSYGYAFKEPSIYQLYIDQFDNIGNPDLKPETLHNIELSTSYKPINSLTLRLDLYGTFLQNLIIYNLNPNLSSPFQGIAGRYQPTQNSSGQFFGGEFSASYNIIQELTLSASYSYLFSRMKSSDLDKYTKIPGDAAHRVKFSTDYLTKNIAANVSFFFVSNSPRSKLFETTNPNDESATDESATQQNNNKLTDIPPYLLIQPHVQFRLPANLALSLQAGLALSEDITKTPTHHYYYETDQTPVSRYSAFLALCYPFAK